MNLYNIRRFYKRAVCILVMLVFTVTCLSSIGGAAFGDDSVNTMSEIETDAYLVGEDGTETPISEEALEELRANSFTEVPDEFEVIVNGEDYGDSAWYDAVSDEASSGISEDEPAADFDGGVSGEMVNAVEEGEEEDAWSLSEEDAEEIEITGDAADQDEEGSFGEMAGTEEIPDAAELGAGDSGDTIFEDELFPTEGNAEHIVIPELIGRSVDLSSGSAKRSKSNAAPDMRGTGTVPSGYFNVDISQNGSTVTVSGSIKAPYSFYGMWVDTTLVAPVTGYSVSQKINMNSFATGYHTVFLGVIENGGSTLIDLIGKKYISSNTLSDKPTYKGKFEVYSKYFILYPYNMAMANTGGDLYIEISKNKGKTWERFGKMNANWIKLFIEQNYKISGLKPNKTYKTRLRFGTYVTYSKDYDGDGASYFFGGPVLNSTTIKTGMAKKPPIRSVTAQAVNVKYHQIRHYGKYTGVYLYTERFYTCKIKVTVTMKKKPGTKGIFINGAWVKGNKKTYTKTFTPYPNYFSKHPRGTKYSVSVISGQNKSWGGYSPTWSKTKRLS